jgi:5-methylcytosine-specific restriction enzyme subunit McrC
MTNDKGIIIKNIYYMLSYAYQSLQQRNFDEIVTESFENVPDILAAILAIGISAQLKHGLSREYIEEQDSLFTLRGKIYIKESLRLKMRNDHKLVCRFDELSENHYMNQILKTTSLYLIHDESVQRKNKDALKKSILFFSKINQLEPSAINWNSFHYNRNNASYLMLMNICYMILHELLLTTEKGKQKLAAFLDDREMSKLYERFILEYYKKEHPRFNPASKEIKWNTTGAADYLPKMQSDTMLIADGNKKKKLIIDAKYYGQILQTWHDAETIRSNHLYQIFSYVKNEDKDNTGLVDGLLLYAKTDDCKIPNSIYNLGGNQIGIQTLDLSKDFLDIKRQLNSIVNEWVKRNAISS